MSPPPREPDQDEHRDARYLVTFGYIVLVPYAAIALWNTWLKLRYGADWDLTDFFLHDFHDEESRKLIKGLMTLFSACFILLLWQWTAFLVGGRTWFSRRRLWAVSSVYFLVMLAVLVYCLFCGFHPAVALILSIIPIVFLNRTVPRWLLSPHADDECSDTQSPSGDGPDLPTPREK